jgi:hypothetical protein
LIRKHSLSKQRYRDPEHLGVVGYDYRQLSGDTAADVPAILNGFKGEVDAVGSGLTYTTQVGKIPFIFNA